MILIIINVHCCNHYYKKVYMFRHNRRRRLFISNLVHPQTLSVVQTRADSLGLAVEVGNIQEVDLSHKEYSGILFQYPDTKGNIYDPTELVQRAHDVGVSKEVRRYSVVY